MNATPSHLIRALKAARRRASGDEQGYLLLYVLGIIALTSVLVVALLGLALTSARVAAMEAAIARDSRAADGALEAQIADIASRGGEVCNTPGARTVEGNEALGGVSSPVEVECRFAGVADNPDASLNGPDVEIVGTAPYAPDGVQPPASDPTLSGGNLVVEGTTAAARFDSDVAVVGGSNPNRTSGSPAVDVAGQYQQGSAVGGSGCGVLGAVGSAHRISDGGGAGSPVCGTPPGVITSAPPYDMSAAVRPASGRNFDCSTGTVNLEPGAYSPSDFTALNGLLSGPSHPTCTVVFQTGTHFLDVYDSSRTPALRNVLVIDNPNVKVIGGTASGDPFPRACSTSSPGVQLVLSPRSAVRHTAGQVALCPMYGPDGGALPVIAQAKATSTQPKLQSVLPATTFSNVAALGGTTAWATGTLCAWSWIFYNCTNQEFSTTWSSPGSGTMTSARLLLEMQERPALVSTNYDTPASYHNVDVRVTFTVTGPVNCSTDAMPVGRSYGGTLSYDLLGSGTCKTQLNLQQQLNGATIRATFAKAGGDNFGLLLNARNIRIETNSAALPASGVAAGGAWTDPNKAQVRDNQPAFVPQTSSGVVATVWEASGHVTQSFALTYRLDSSGLKGSDSVDRLSVLVAGPANELSVVSDPGDGGSTTVTLTTADGQQCRTTTPGYWQSSAAARFDLMSNGGDCAPKVLTASQLDGATVTFSVQSGCTTPQQAGAPAGKCSSVQLPRVDLLSLAVGTDSYADRPPYSSLSVDVANRTSFDVFGPVYMPTADLQVRWVGSAYPRPIFAGPLQLSGLGIVQLGPTQGPICCVVNEKGAVLVAKVNGVVRAQAAVRVDVEVTGTPTARRPVQILSWKLCGRSGC